MNSIKGFPAGDEKQTLDHIGEHEQSNSSSGPKFSIVHDRFAVYTGSEKVVESIYEVYPASMYSLFVNDDVVKKTIFESIDIKKSFIQNLPRVNKWYQSYLPFFPLAIEQFDLSGYDVILSSSHTVAKGVLTTPDQLHICYCHTPMRYAWDLYHDYLRDSGLQKGMKGMVAKLILHYLRVWDTSSASRVDYFVANSEHVSRRIRKIYGRESVVIYPPVDIEQFQVFPIKEDYYVTASRLVQYKRIDLIVEAFSHMPEKRLVVIGDGPDMQKIKAKASRNIDVVGYQSDDMLVAYLQKAKAFVFAAQEDFGIVPVEAQACGTPIIAYGRGGVSETVIQGKTGILFGEQSVDSLMNAVKTFDKQQSKFDPLVIRKNAERFSKERFKKEFKLFVDSKVKAFFCENMGNNLIDDKIASK